MRFAIPVIMALLLLPVSVAAEIVSEPLTYLKTAGSLPMPFCSTSFESSGLSYNPNCGSSGIISVGDVADACWTSTINFNGRTISLQNNQKVALPNSPFAVSMKASGRVKNGVFETPALWSVLYTFELTDPNFLTSSIVNVQNVQTLGKDFSIAVKTTNSFISCSGGYYVRASPRLYPAEERYFYPQVVAAGTGLANVPYKASTLGVLDFKVYPYIQIGEVKLIQNVPASKSFFIAPVVNSPEVQACNSNADCPSGYTCEAFQTSTGTANYCSNTSKPVQDSRKAVIIGVFAVALSTALIIVIIRRKGRKR